MTTEKERKREYNKKYNEENRERIAANQLEWQRKNKEKVNKYNREWKKANSEKVKLASRVYSENNKEKIAVRNKTWSSNNKDKVNEKSRRWVKNNPDKAKEKTLKWQKEHPEENAASKKNWADKNPDRIRTSHLKRNFGITVVEYNALFEFQNGLCAICGSDNEGKSFCVDHDHESGKIRGLLCKKCNSGIGFLKDDMNIIKKALFYLGSRK